MTLVCFEILRVHYLAHIPLKICMQKTGGCKDWRTGQNTEGPMSLRGGNASGSSEIEVRI